MLKYILLGTLALGATLVNGQWTDTYAISTDPNFVMSLTWKSDAQYRTKYWGKDPGATTDIYEQYGLNLNAYGYI